MIPVVPRGAAILSITTAFLAAGERQIHTERRFSTVIGVLGGLLDYCASGQRDAREVLLHHTLAPILVTCASNHERETTLIGMLRGERPPAFMQIRKKVASLIRRCPECVKDDLHTGFAYARVTHQLRHVVRCHDHGVPLQEVCAECGKPFGEFDNPRLPYSLYIHRCTRCGSALGRDLEQLGLASYDALSALIHGAMSGHVLKSESALPLISRFLAATQRQGRDPIQSFCDLWAVNDLATAAEKCGASARALELTLIGKRNLKDVWTTMALVSAAVAYFRSHTDSVPREIHQLDLRAKCVEGDEFAGRLLQRAQDFGLSEGVAHSLLRGQKPSRRLLSAAPRACFHAALSDDERKELQARAAARKAGVAYPELNVRLMREFTKRAIADGVDSRSAFISYNRIAYKWMLRFDSEWMAEQLPPRTVGHELARRRSLAWRKKGVVTREQLRREDPNLYRWMRVEDPHLFEACFPGVDKSDVGKADAREVAVKLLEGEPKQRFELLKRDPGLYRSLIKNDKEWLDSEFPERIDSRIDYSIEELEWARRAALASINCEPRERAHLYRADKELYQWLLHNDKDWFEREFRQSRRSWSTVGVEVARRAALDSVQGKPKLRTRVYRAERKLYEWLLENDKGWFDREFPVGGGLRRNWTVERARSAALQLIKDEPRVRARLHRIDLSLYGWLHKNDKEWFDREFPRNRVWSAIKVETARRAALDLVQGGPHLRSRVYGADGKLYKWLLENDKEWFDREFPVGGGLRRNWTAKKAREAALELAQYEPRLRARLRSDSSLYKWLLENDKEWFDREFPTRSYRDWSKMDVEDARRAALHVVQGGPKQRFLVREADPTLHAWLLRNDRKWYQGEFSTRRRTYVQKPRTS